VLRFISVSSVATDRTIFIANIFFCYVSFILFHQLMQAVGYCLYRRYCLYVKFCIFLSLQRLLAAMSLWETVLMCSISVISTAVAGVVFYYMNATVSHKTILVVSVSNPCVFGQLR
jgi:hypothetical protein